MIDPDSNRVTDAISVGSRPGAIAAGSGSLWVANRDDQNVSRIDPDTSSVTKVIPVVDTPTGLAAVDGATWVVGSNVAGPSVSLRRIDPQFDTVAPKIQIDNVAPGGPGAAACSRQDRLDRAVLRPAHAAGPADRPRRRRASIRTQVRQRWPSEPDAVWVADSDAGTVTRVDPTGLLTPITVGGSPSAIAVGAGGVWVANRSDDTVVRIDPSTRAVTTTIPVGKAPAGIAVSPGSVWVANSGDGTVSRIDPETGEVSETIDVGESPQSIIAANGRIWVTVQRQTIGSIPVESSGGTARLSTGGIDSVDPALACHLLVNPASLRHLRMLLNYPDKPAPAGAKLIPEVAESLPTRSADGKTYTFTIRKGFRFSLRRACHGADVQARDRAHPQPCHEELLAELLARPRRRRRLRIWQGGSHQRSRCEGKPADASSLGARARSPLPARAALLLRRPARDAARPQGRRSHRLCRPLSRDLVHPRGERRARAQPELHGQPSPSPRPDGAHHRGNAAERRRQDRGRNRRLRAGRCRCRRRRQTRGALRPGKPGGAERQATVLRQQAARDRGFLC